MDPIITSGLAGLALILALISGEVKSFKTASSFIVAYGIILAILIGLKTPQTGLVALAVTAIATPGLIIWVSQKTDIKVEPPNVGVMGKAPFALIFGVLTPLVLYNMGITYPELLLGVTLVAFGLLILVSKNNLVKFLIGLVYMHTGATISTGALYPPSSVATIFEIAYFSILLVVISMIAYFTILVHSKSGTIFSKDLTNLRW